MEDVVHGSERNRCNAAGGLSDVLMAALGELPMKQREAIVLHHLVELPVAQIAREIGVPEGTVKARLPGGAGP